MESSTNQFLIKTLKENARPDSKHSAYRYSQIKALLSRNESSPYPDTDEGKEQVFSELYQKLANVTAETEQIYTTGKNLIYFTVFLSDEFLDLTVNCLESILEKTQNINFDVLFITDEEYKEKLLTKSIISNFNCHFHVVTTPVTGPRASLQKIYIHDFSLINNYENIFYLDSDIICLKDINLILNLPFEVGKLYTANTSQITSYALITPSHGLMYLTDRDAEYLALNPDKVKPFNAGQFLFKNSLHMRKHFENVRWLVEIWPGEFFFEQSVLNHYFALNSLNVLINDLAQKPFVSVAGMEVKMHTNKEPEPSRSLVVTGATKTACPSAHPYKRDPYTFTSEWKIPFNEDNVLIHFAGKTLRGQIKKDRMSSFLTNHASKLSA